MIKTIWIGVWALLILILVYAVIPGDTFNKIARKQIEFVNGDYNVTYSQDSITKVYKVNNGKITSTSKGYYYFWIQTPSGKKYRQTPIDKTLIEEI